MASKAIVPGSSSASELVVSSHMQTLREVVLADCHCMKGIQHECLQAAVSTWSRDEVLQAAALSCWALAPEQLDNDTVLSMDTVPWVVVALTVIAVAATTRCTDAQD